LYLEGAVASPEAGAVRARLLAGRALNQEDRMVSLRRSLDDLVPYAAARHVCLGLEARPLDEVPSFDELEQVLSWYPAETLGYWHDTGHAQVQADLGCTPHADWLRAYGARLVGLHLHDAVGLEVHRAPGAGTVDWERLASLVPPQVVRTIEVYGGVSRQALLDGLQHLRATHWA
jgi:sugar phosphate isomerase/epimerase